MIQALLLGVLAVAGSGDTSRDDSGDRAERLLAEHAAADRSLVAGDLEAAGGSFWNCTRIDDGLAAAHYGLACVASRQGRLDDAWGHLEAAAARGWYEPELARWDEDLAALIERDPARVEDLLRAPAGALLPEPLEIRELQGPEVPAATALALSAGGQLAMGDARGGVWIGSAHAPEGPLRSLAPLTGSVLELAFSRDGCRLAGVDREGVLRMWKVDGTESRGESTFRPLDGMDWNARNFGVDLAWSEDGTHLALYGPDAVLRLFTPTRETKATHSLPRTTVHAGVQWAGSHLHVAEGSGLLRLDPEQPSSDPEAIDCGNRITSFDLAPNGVHVATGHIGRACVWDLGTGALLREFRTPTARSYTPKIRSVAYSPDGRKLAYQTGGFHGVVVHSLADGAGDTELYTRNWTDGALAWHASGILVLGSSSKHFLVPFEDAHAAVPVLESNRLVWLVPDSRRWLWRRQETGSTPLLVSSRGWYSGPAKAHDLAFQFDRDGVTCAYRRGDRLFDPKRVRALLAGVPVGNPPAP